MILRNSTDKDVHIVIDGTEYSIPAEGEKDVPEKIAVKWRETHAFLEVGSLEPVQEEKPRAKKTTKKED